MNSSLLKNSGILILMLFLFSCKNAEKSGWAKQGGGESYDGGRAMALDSKGNLYVIGRFQGNAKFDDQFLKGRGDDGIFLLKYNSEGKLIWSKDCGGKGEDSGYAIDIDSQDNIFIVGYFADTAFFNSVQLMSKGESDAFVARYDTTGNVVWVKQCGGQLKDYGRGVGTDEAGNIYITGFFTGTITFDTTRVISKGFYEDAFIASYDANGNLRWAKGAGSGTDDRSVAISTDKQGNSFITGFFSETIAFDSIRLTSSGLTDPFIAMYDNKGNALWAKQVKGADADEGRSVAADDQGNVYVTGFFLHTISFDEGGSNDLTSKGDRDIFIAKYDASGKLLWAKRAGGSGIDEGTAVSVANAGDCLVTGFFDQDADFQDTTLKTAGNSDVFAAHYRQDGKLCGVLSAGSKGSDEGRGAISDGKNYLYLTGNYNGMLKIGDLELPQSAGDGDIFVAKVADPCGK